MSIMSSLGGSRINDRMQDWMQIGMGEGNSYFLYYLLNLHGGLRDECKKYPVPQEDGEVWVFEGRNAVLEPDLEDELKFKFFKKIRQLFYDCIVNIFQAYNPMHNDDPKLQDMFKWNVPLDSKEWWDSLQKVQATVQQCVIRIFYKICKLIHEDERNNKEFPPFLDWQQKCQAPPHIRQKQLSLKEAFEEATENLQDQEYSSDTYIRRMVDMYYCLYYFPEALKKNNSPYTAQLYEFPAPAPAAAASRASSMNEEQLKQMKEQLQQMLRDAPPEQHKQMIGEKLYTLIQVEQGSLAGKITGMLLRGLDNSELVALIDDQATLQNWIQQALADLKEQQQAKEEHQQANRQWGPDQLWTRSTKNTKFPAPLNWCQRNSTPSLDTPGDEEQWPSLNEGAGKNFKRGDSNPTNVRTETPRAKILDIIDWKFTNKDTRRYRGAATNDGVWWNDILYFAIKLRWSITRRATEQSVPHDAPDEYVSVPAEQDTEPGSVPVPAEQDTESGSEEEAPVAKFDPTVSDERRHDIATRNAEVANLANRSGAAEPERAPRRLPPLRDHPSTGGEPTGEEQTELELGSVMLTTAARNRSMRSTSYRGTRGTTSYLVRNQYRQTWGARVWPHPLARKSTGAEADKFRGSKAVEAGVRYPCRHYWGTVKNKFERDMMTYCVSRQQLDVSMGNVDLTYVAHLDTGGVTAAVRKVNIPYLYFYVKVKKTDIENWLDDYELALELEEETDGNYENRTRAMWDRWSDTTTTPIPGKFQYLIRRVKKSGYKGKQASKMTHVRQGKNGQGPRIIFHHSAPAAQKLSNTDPAEDTENEVANVFSRVRFTVPTACLPRSDYDVASAELVDFYWYIQVSDFLKTAVSQPWVNQTSLLQAVRENVPRPTPPIPRWVKFAYRCRLWLAFMTYVHQLEMDILNRHNNPECDAKKLDHYEQIKHGPRDYFLLQAADASSNPYLLNYSLNVTTPDVLLQAADASSNQYLLNFQ